MKEVTDRHVSFSQLLDISADPQANDSSRPGGLQSRSCHNRQNIHHRRINFVRRGSRSRSRVFPGLIGVRLPGKTAAARPGRLRGHGLYARTACRALSPPAARRVRGRRLRNLNVNCNQITTGTAFVLTP